MFCKKCNHTGYLTHVLWGQREFGGDASTVEEYPCDCNPQPCPNCLEEKKQLQTEIFRYNEELSDARSKIEQLEAEIVKKDELIFAYDATRSPVIDRTVIDLQAKVVLLKELLKVAKCPNKCTNGTVATPPHGDAEECQWCYMVEQALEVKP